MEQRGDSGIDISKMVKEHQLFIFRTAIGFVHNQHDAEDITQEVFIKAYQNLEKFRGESEISTWLYRIAVNCSLNFLAKSKRRASLWSDKPFWESSPKGRDEKTPQRQLELSEEESRVAALIDKLPKRQRTAFILSRYNELSQKEVAEVMEISEGAVEQLLFRARGNLTTHVEREWGRKRIDKK